MEGDSSSTLLVIVALLLFLPTSVHSEEPQFKFGGTAEIFIAQYLEHVAGKYDTFAQLRLRPKLEAKFSETFLLFTQADLRQDTEGIAHGAIDDIVEKDYPWAVNLAEFYMQYSNDILTVLVGKQIFDWSVTDTVSPSDNLSPRDWTDLIEWERIGIPAINIKVGQDHYLQAVYVPFFTPSKLPLINERWIPESSPSLITPEALPDKTRGQFAIRTGTTARSIDFALTYFNGFSFSPALFVAPAANGNLGTESEYFNEQVVSASISTVIENTAVRAEVGYFDQNGEEDFFQYVIGADREWSNIISPPDTFYALVQYVNAVKTGGISLSNPELTDFRQVFNNSIMSRLKYTFPGGRWAIKLEGALDLGHFDSYVEPAVVLTLNSFEIEAGISIISGEEGTFWGSFDKNDRLFLMTKYSF